MVLAVLLHDPDGCKSKFWDSKAWDCTINRYQSLIPVVFSYLAFEISSMPLVYDLSRAPKIIVHIWEFSCHSMLTYFGFADDTRCAQARFRVLDGKGEHAGSCACAQRVSSAKHPTIKHVKVKVNMEGPKCWLGGTAAHKSSGFCQ